MERSRRARRWWLLVTLVLVACAKGNVDDGNGAGDGAALPPDAEGEDASVTDDVQEPTDVKAGEVSVSPEDVEVPDAGGLDATSGMPDSGPGELDAGAFDAGVMDVPVVDVEMPDAPDVPDVSTDGGCPPGASLCSGTCVSHGATTSACTSATSFGSFCGDNACGFLCPSTRYRVVVTRTGTTSQWFRARAVECSVCPGATIVARVNLRSPAGANYDLFVHRPCNSIAGRATNGAGATDTVEVRESDSLADGDNFEYFIEVRHVSGESCEPWTLTLEARGNNGSSC